LSGLSDRGAGAGGVGNVVSEPFDVTLAVALRHSVNRRPVVLDGGFEDRGFFLKSRYAGSSFARKGALTCSRLFVTGRHERFAPRPCTVIELSNLLTAHLQK